MARYTWKPFDVLRKPEGIEYGVMKMNCGFQNSNDLLLFNKLWKNARLRCGADGGCNILFDCLPISHLPPFLPHFISGDFDSIKQDTKDFYEDKGVEIIPTPDQNHTDFTKCLRILNNKNMLGNYQLEYIVAHIGTSTCRLDHTLSNINTLLTHTTTPHLHPCLSPSTHHQPSFHLTTTHLSPTTPINNITSVDCLTQAPASSSPHVETLPPSTPLPSSHPPSTNPSSTHPSSILPPSTLPPSTHPFLLSIMGDSVCFILPPGNNTIETASSLRGRWCSLVPLTAPTTTSTTGLVYNMEGEVMQFGALISTSNAFLPGHDHVTVQNDHPLLFSIALNL